MFIKQAVFVFRRGSESTRFTHRLAQIIYRRPKAASSAKPNSLSLTVPILASPFIFVILLVDHIIRLNVLPSDSSLALLTIHHL